MKVFATQGVCWFLNDVFRTYGMSFFSVSTTVCTIFKITFSNFCGDGDAIAYFVRWNFNRSVCDVHARIVTLYSPVTVSTFLDSHFSTVFQRNLNLISSVVCGWCHFQVTVLPLSYRWCGWRSFGYFQLNSRVFATSVSVSNRDWNIFGASCC